MIAVKEYYLSVPIHCREKHASLKRSKIYLEQTRRWKRVDEGKGKTDLAMN